MALRQTRRPCSVSLDMTIRNGIWTPLLLLLAAQLLAPCARAVGDSGRAASRELAPGVSIERSAPNPEAEARRQRLREWHRVYLDSLAPLRRAVGVLFTSLERSSLASLKGRCQAIRDRVEAVDRATLFPSSQVGIDRVLYGSLERFRAAAIECLAARNLGAYRLLLEARAGLEWVDQRLEIELTPPVRLPGLSEGDEPSGNR